MSSNVDYLNPLIIRFQVKDKYIKYFESINTSSEIRLHSHYTLERYLKRTEILDIINKMEYVGEVTLEGVRRHLNSLRRGIDFYTFYSHFQGKLKFEFLEKMYLTPEDIITYIIFEYETYKLFKKDYGTNIAIWVEYLAYYTLDENNLNNKNLNKFYDEYSHILLPYWNKEHALEICRRVLELEKTLISLR